MDEYNKSLIKRWHDSRVFNLEKDMLGDLLFMSEAAPNLKK